MFLVTYDLNNKSGVDLILPEIRRHKSVRLAPATYALVSAENIQAIELQFRDKVLPGDKIWIFTAEGPYTELEFSPPPPDTLIH